MEPARLRTILRALGAAAFFTSAGLAWLFATGEAGSWRDPRSWPLFVRIAGLSLIVIGISLPNLWLLMHTSGPETSSRRFAILCSVLLALPALALAANALDQPSRIPVWLWFLGYSAFAGVLIRGIWLQRR